MKELTRAQIEEDMQKVLDVRYTDLELEKSLCLNLLNWGNANQDLYVTAFAHTYLGDYYVAHCDGIPCATHLMEARDMALENGYDSLLVRIFSLLGVYYEVVADEQSALQYYLEALIAARRTKDVASEGLMLNNIAFSLHRHHGYAPAIQLYRQAYDLIQNCKDSNSPTTGIILGNLASACVSSGQLDEAKEYIVKCEAVINGSILLDALRSQCWCQYYAAAGDLTSAKLWADHIFAREEEISSDRPNSFDIYAISFDSMLQLHDRDYCTRFLKLVDMCCDYDSPDQRNRLEERHIAYSLEFETGGEQLDAAYKRYCVQTKELLELSNQVITNGLKSAIQLSRVMRQRERLKAETSNLKNQVNLDELTGVYTRRYLEQLIKQYENKRVEAYLGVIMLDVDCLKEYNDTYGHLEGDAVLRTVGECLRFYLPEKLYPCRFGGDEFICLCAGLTDDEIIGYINQVRAELEKKNIPHRTSGCAQVVTLSIGFSNEPVSYGVSMHTLLELADRALYHSKLNGRNTYSKQGY